MKSTYHAILIASAVVLGGCSTTQNVLLAKQAPPRIVTVAQAPDAGNSPEMDSILQSALVSQGYTVRAALPEGTRKSDEVDAIVSYVDVWRWDIVMYLQSVAIKMFDARNGDLLVTGDWRNSAFHGFQDEAGVVQQLVGEMSQKLKAASAETAAEPQPAVASSDAIARASN